MTWENRRYVIFNASETGSFDWDSVLDNSASLRSDISGSNILIKWDGSSNMPSAVQSLTTRVTSSLDSDGSTVNGSGISGSFTWSEIQSVLDTPGIWCFPTGSSE